MTALRPKAVVLLSGGLDSSTTLAIALKQGFECHALTFRYGQRHAAELDAARRVASHMDVDEHVMVDLPQAVFAASALTAGPAVPKGRSTEELTAGIPVTYVPARNTVFLSIALAWAETLGARDLFIGINAVDYSGYPDCRPEFLEAFQRMATLATKAGVEGDQEFRVHAPLIRMSKAEIVRTGLELGVDYSLTSTCYSPSADGRACGQCDACQLRLKGFAEIGAADPARYQGQEGARP